MSGKHRYRARHARPPRNSAAPRQFLAAGAVGLVIPFAAGHALSPGAPPAPRITTPTEAIAPVMWDYAAAEAARLHLLHIAHVAHRDHMNHLAALALAKAAAIAAAQRAAASPARFGSSAPHSSPVSAGSSGLSGHLSFGELERLWVIAGGPAWAEAHAAEIAECESGGNQYATNPSGAAGYFQILGQVVFTGKSIYDPMTNALNAVSKFHAGTPATGRDNFGQWVCT